MEVRRQSFNIQKDGIQSYKVNKERQQEQSDKFYEDNSNSRCAAGKKECITRKNIKKQKRFLLDSSKNLHQKFLSTNSIIIGYSLFCRLHPFWVVEPKFIVLQNIDQTSTS